MTNRKTLGVLVALAMTLPFTAQAWTVVDEPVDLAQIPEELRDLTWVRMTPHPGAARENLYGVNSRDNPAARAFLRSNDAVFNPASGGNRSRLDTEADFGPFLGVNYNIPVELLPEDSEAWEGLLEAGIVERIEAAPAVEGEPDGSVLELYTSLRTEFLAEQERLTGLIAGLSERLGEGEEGLAGEVNAVRSELETLRGNTLELADLEPLNTSIAFLMAAVERIEANLFTDDDARILREEVETSLGAVEQSIATLREEFSELSGRVTAEAEARVAGDEALNERISGVAGDVADLRTDLESVQQVPPFAWLYEPLGLSEWYEENAGVGNVSAAGVLLIVLAILAVLMREILPNRGRKLAKANQRQLNGEDGQSGLVGDVTSLKTTVGSVVDRLDQLQGVTDDLTTLALDDLEWHTENPDLDNLQPGDEGIVTWRVRRKGDSGWCVVAIGRESDTPLDRVYTDLRRKRGDDAIIETPILKKRLKLAIKSALQDGRLVPRAPSAIAAE